jgi:hypothetical protein
MEPSADRHRQRRIVLPPKDEGWGLEAYEVRTDIRAEELPQGQDESPRSGSQGVHAEHRQEREWQVL